MTMIEGIPRYTRWEQVPDGLYTRTQLGRLDPPRRPVKGAQPRARVLYHGNKYADLYDLESDSEEKPPATEAQRAAIAKAQQARITCRRCGGHDTDPDTDAPVPLPKGRLCRRCREVLALWNEHVEKQASARRTLDRGLQRGILVVTVDDASAPRRLAAIGYSPGDLEQGRAGEVLADVAVAAPDATPGEGERTGPDAVVALSRSVLAWSSDINFEIVSWRSARFTLIKLLSPDLDWSTPWRDAAPETLEARREAWAAIEEHPWADEFAGYPGDPVRRGRWTTLESAYAIYYCDRSADGGGLISALTWHLPLPGATGVLVEDAWALMALLRGMAADTEPISPRAPWLLYPPTAEDV